MTAKELLSHSTVIVTKRYTHSNLASKVVAVGQLGSVAKWPLTHRIRRN
jgi:hypothetical protein